MNFSCPLTRGPASSLPRNGNEPRGLVVIRGAVEATVESNLLETGPLQQRLELPPRVNTKCKTKLVSPGLIEDQPAIVDRAPAAAYFPLLKQQHLAVGGRLPRARLKFARQDFLAEDVDDQPAVGLKRLEDVGK